MGCSGSHRWLPVSFWHREVTEIPLIASAASPWQGRFGYVRRALADVTRPGGSAGSAFAGFPQDRFPVAGKTGTGEVFGQDATAWFAGYGPDAPQVRRRGRGQPG